VRVRVVAGIARNRAEGTDRLRQPPAIAGPLVDGVARLHEFARTLKIHPPHCLNAESVEEHGATVLVSALLAEREALLVQPLGRLVVAVDVVEPPYARKASARISAWTASASGRSRRAANQRIPSAGSLLTQNHSSADASLSPSPTEPLLIAQDMAPRKLSRSALAISDIQAAIYAAPEGDEH
jgi:hypothetical protein